MRGGVHRSRTAWGHPWLRPRHQLDVGDERLKRREGRPGVEHRPHDAHRERSLGEKPVQDGILGREIDVRMHDRPRAVRLLERTHERVDEASPSEARDLEQEAVERSPVVVEKSRRLTERLGHDACAELVAKLRDVVARAAPLLQQITDEPRCVVTRDSLRCGHRSFEGLLAMSGLTVPPRLRREALWRGAHFVCGLVAVTRSRTEHFVAARRHAARAVRRARSATLHAVRAIVGARAVHLGRHAVLVRYEAGSLGDAALLSQVAEHGWGAAHDERRVCGVREIGAGVRASGVRVRDVRSTVSAGAVRRCSIERRRLILRARERRAGQRRDANPGAGEHEEMSEPSPHNARLRAVDGETKWADISYAK